MAPMFTAIPADNNMNTFTAFLLIYALAVVSILEFTASKLAGRNIHPALNETYSIIGCILAHTLI